MINKLIKLGKERGLEIEVFFDKTKETSICTLNEEEKSFDISDISVYNIKALRDNKCARMSTGNLLNPEKVLEHLENILSIQENDNPNSLCEGVIEHVLEERRNPDFEKVKKDMLSLNDLRIQYKEIINIEVNYIYSNAIYDIRNENSRKVNELNCHSFEVIVSLGSKEKPISLVVSDNSKEYNFKKVKEMVENKLKNGLYKINAISCQTDKYKVLLDKEVVTSILSIFKNMFQTKNIELKTSILTDKFKEKIFSEKITIVEDPHGENAIIPKFFDSEGTSTNYKELVKDGKFIGEINDIEYAMKTNATPTGNADGVNNLYIVPNKEKTDLIKKLENGIYVDSVVGTHSGIDTVTGNISLQAEGYIVLNGKITKGLNMIILSTNVFEIFSNIIEVGSELSSIDTSVLAPDLLLENITITGRE